jgi:hypothetical protein
LWCSQCQWFGSSCNPMTMISAIWQNAQNKSLKIKALTRMDSSPIIICSLQGWAYFVA